MSGPASPGLALSGLGLPAGHLAKISQTLGLPISRDDDAGTGLILLADLAKHSLREALGRRPVICVEWNSTGIDALAKLISLVPPSKPAEALALSVTTATAARHAVARLFKDALARALPPSIPAEDVAEFCITELVTNAIIHGNLAIGNGGYADAQGLGDFAAEVDARLENAAFAARRLTICATWDSGRLCVAVTDEGDGFELPDHPQEMSSDQGTGRGLGLIRSLGVTLRSEDKGRRICLIFP
jgi:anti-sigma regulatory factor (Ser/Thr protein kinase)